ETHVHPGRVGPDGQVDEAFELGEGDDLVQLLADVHALEPEDRAVEIDVLPPGEVGVEAGAELEQRADATADVDPPRRRLDDPSEQPEQRRLPRAVPADDADRTAGLDADRDVAKGDDLLAGEPPSGEREVLQRPHRLRVHAERAARPLDDDLAGPHVTSFAIITADSR